MTAQERHNAICNITGEALWGFQWAMVLPATVLTVLLTQLGAEKTTIGLIPSLDGLAMLLPIIGIYLFRSHKKRRFRIVMFHYLAMIPFLGLMGVAIFARAHISPNLLKVFLIGGWAMYVSAIGVVGAAWVDWIAHLFRREIRGTITGVSWGCSNLAGVAGALAAGRLLRASDDLNSFAWLYVAAFVIATISITIFLLIRDPAENAEHDHAPELREIVDAARESLTNRPFRAVLIGRCLGLAGFCVGPFIAVHYLSPAGGSLPDSLVVSLGAAQTAGSAASCMLFGRIGDRIGHRFGMIMGTVFQLASLASALLIRGPAGCLLSLLFAGCVGGTLTISYMNIVVESCPHNVRSAHLMIGNMVVGLAGLLLPMAGARLAERAGIPKLLAASLIMSALALAWNLWKVKDPRTPTPSESAETSLLTASAH